MTMALDNRIEEAIKAAVIEVGQSDALARRLIAWMTALVSENEDINNFDSAERHLDLLFEETKIKS
jgi:hypothetical protein